MKFFRIPFNPDDSDASETRSNRLYKYIQSQSAQDMARLASEISPDVRQIIASNVQALLGYLPPQDFTTTIMVGKENLQNLLASSMLTGYFMHAMENRMLMDSLFEGQVEDASPKDAEAETAETVEPVELAQLKNPQELFSGLEPSAAKPSETEKLEELGRFWGLEELQQESLRTDHKMNIQMEISTRMDRQELTELLRELSKFQDASTEELASEDDSASEPED